MRTLHSWPVIASLALPIGAQSVVAPNAYEAVRGTGGVSSLVNPTTTPRTWMLGIQAAELSRIPIGAKINGVSFRQYFSTANPALWPPADATFAGYDITIGYAQPFASWGATFASNFLSTPLPPVTVRSGPMVIEANKFTSNPTLPGTQPNAFGDFYWDFQQTFTYLGGDLAILFTHTGQGGSLIFLDYVTVPTTVAWLGSGYQATGGGAVHVACIARIHWGYGSACPGTGGALPNLVTTNDTTGGGAATFALANAPAGALAAYALGVVKVASTLPNGCALSTPPVLVLPVTLSARGRYSLTLTVPPAAFGTVELQGLVLDAGAPGGYTTTNGVTFTAR